MLRSVIERVGRCGLHLECERNQFGALVDAIIYQQLAYKAAQTIARRFRQIYSPRVEGPGQLPTPHELKRTPVDKLRRAGLSRQKIGYLRDLARKASDGTLTLGKFTRVSDEAVIENVTQVKGIGRWTAEMFLIFSLRRPDVLPVDDLGLQYGFKEAYRMRALPSATKMQKLGEAWRPYRSIATWYLWKVRRLQTKGGGA
ncbi:MAG: DNA-3-methyladenine glycosylase [Acidobacteria bacterium]|nr:DNA-3-methyladenine glycosylase [Acidobacteriota bacterium]MCL5289317.1 DNA-3-methyladenine glycosylase [Acidobacteriota bacterium]